MRKKSLGFLMLVLLLVVLVQGEAQAGFWPFTSKSKQPEKLEYSVEVTKPVNKNTYNLNLFYPVNGIYTDIFYQLDLMEKFTLEEKTKIIKEIFFNLSADNVVFLTIQKFDGKNPLAVGFKIVKYEDKNALMVVSNYDPKKKKVIMNKEEMKNASMNVYIICGEKLVAYSCLYSAAEEAELLKGEEWNNLGDRLLFDELADNDIRIADALGKGLETDVPELKFAATMTFVQFYLMSGNFESARQSLENGSTIIDNEIEDKDYWGKLYKMTDEVYQITKELYQFECGNAA